MRAVAVALALICWLPVPLAGEGADRVIRLGKAIVRKLARRAHGLQPTCFFGIDSNATAGLSLGSDYDSPVSDRAERAV